MAFNKAHFDPRPQPHEGTPNSLFAADLALATQWIALNRDTIVAFWDGLLDIDEALARLRRLT